MRNASAKLFCTWDYRAWSREISSSVQNEAYTQSEEQNRFTWGDFAALSYTRVDPHDEVESDNNLALRLLGTVTSIEVGHLHDARKLLHLSRVFLTKMRHQATIPF